MAPFVVVPLPFRHRDARVADLVESCDELPALRSQRDRLGRDTAHGRDDVDPRLAVRMQKAHAIDAIDLGIVRILDVVFCREQVAAREVLGGVSVLVEYFVLVAGDLHFFARSGDGHQPFRACTREDGSDVDIRVLVRASDILRNYAVLEHAEELGHFRRDIHLVVTPLLLQDEAAGASKGRKVLRAGVVQPALHAVAAFADVAQPGWAHAKNFRHGSEDDVRHPHDVAVYLVVETPEVRDFRVGVDRDLFEPRVVGQERDAGGQEELLVERAELIRSLGVLAPERAVAALPAVASLLVSHPHLFTPVHEEYAKQLVELLEKLGRDAVIAEADKSNHAERLLQFQEEPDARGGGTFGVGTEGEGWDGEH